MKDKTHIVIDIETLSAKPDAKILSIGAVAFKLGSNNWAEFYTGGILDDNGHVCGDTQKWWQQQSREAWKHAFSGGSRINRSLADLASFVGSMEKALIWAKGPSFDCVILEHAFKRHGIDCPWKYWQHRDMRTIIDLYPEVKEIAWPGEPHIALVDAIYEATQLSVALGKHYYGIEG